MNRLTAPQHQPSAQPAPRKLTLKKETLRRLTSAELRLAAGGMTKTQGNALCVN